MAETKRIGKYELLEELGRGGFAVVYKARDVILGRVVALKVLSSQLMTDPRFVQRFQQEAQTAAQFHHPHIVPIYDVGHEKGLYYLAMAYLEGRTLDKIITDGSLTLEQAITVIEQIAGALDLIHSRGLVHRDIKPANIMIDEDGQATLLDFGIVRAAEGTRLTTAMAVLGTPEYMSPEQAEVDESAGIDWRADLYALSVVAYEMLVGRPPFTGNSPTAVLYKHVYETPPQPTALNSAVPSCVEPVLLKGLAKKREERFQKASDFARQLSRSAMTAPTVLPKEHTESQQQLRTIPLSRSLARPAPSKAPTWLIVGGMVLLLIIFLSLVVLFGFWQGWWGPVAPIVTVQITDEPTVPPTDILIGKLTDEVLTDGLLDDEVTVETSFPFNTWVRQADGMVMVHVPKGEFEMGSDVGEADERPVHKVGLDEFWFDQTAVTNSQYALCVKARECGVSGYVDDVDFGGGDYPVVGVSWYDAANYCEWVGARLPTEAEWEYAARGPENLVYPWGNSFDCLRGNFDDETSLDIISFGCDGYLKTSPVGSFPEGASWCGVLDLSGNVWDWVEDWYAEYPSENQENPTGSITGEYKVIRGGSWGSDNNLLLRGASRNSRDPNGSNNIVIGFRCAMSEIEN